MTPRIITFGAIAALLVSVASSESPSYRVLLAFIVTVGAIAVLTQATRTKNPAWVVLFTAAAILLNPTFTGALRNSVYLWTDLACLMAFSAALLSLKNQPVLSMASITDRTPGSESV